MREKRPGRCASLGRSDARGNAGRYVRQGPVGAGDKTWLVREARQGGCASQHRADARGKAGQIREARQGKAGQGMSRQGKMSHGRARLGGAKQGSEGHGRARQDRTR
jgi:hypothetical protein